MAKDFLEILEEYFLNLKDENILEKDSKGGIVIRMQYIFSPDLERRDMETAFANLLKEYNKFGYENRLNEVLWRKNPNTIQNIILKTNKEELEFLILGLDNKSLVSIGKMPRSGAGIAIVSQEDLYREILNVLKQKEGDTSRRATDMLALKGIKQSMSEVAENLVEYYKYLVEEKTKQGDEIQDCGSTNIVQREDSKAPSVIIQNRKRNQERVNPIYSFEERKAIWENMFPKKRCQISYSQENADEDGEYQVYIYERANGKLFVAEPSEGDKTTRLVFLTSEEYDAFETKRAESKELGIAKKYLSMSNQEFAETPKTTVLLHRDLEGYTERATFLVLRKISQRISKGKGKEST